MIFLIFFRNFLFILTKLVVLTIYDSGDIMKMCLTIHGYSDAIKILMDLSETQNFQYDKNQIFLSCSNKKAYMRYHFSKK